MTRCTLQGVDPLVTAPRLSEMLESQKHTVEKLWLKGLKWDALRFRLGMTPKTFIKLLAKSLDEREKERLFMFS